MVRLGYDPGDEMSETNWRGVKKKWLDFLGDFLNFLNNVSLERKFPKRVRQQQQLGAFRRQCPKREELPPRQLQPDEQQQLREADGRQLRLEVGRIDAAGACVEAQQIISRLVRPK